MLLNSRRTLISVGLLSIAFSVIFGSFVTLKTGSLDAVDLIASGMTESQVIDKLGAPSETGWHGGRVWVWQYLDGAVIVSWSAGKVVMVDHNPDPIEKRLWIWIRFRTGLLGE